MLNARGWVPQSRERVYIVGFRRNLHVPPMDWTLLKAQSENACSITVGDVLEPPDSLAVVCSVPCPVRYFLAATFSFARLCIMGGRLWSRNRNDLRQRSGRLCRTNARHIVAGTGDRAR